MSIRLSSRWVWGGVLALAFVSPGAAQDKPPEAKAEPASQDPVTRIRAEGLERSQVMETLSYLCDVIGPRLTASPSMKRANEWTRDTMTKWGLQNAHLESWGPFGRGWTLEAFSAQVIEPDCQPLIAWPKAWSPSINGSGADGRLVAEVVLFAPKTEDEVATFKGRIKDRIVLMGDTRDVKAHFEPEGLRYTDTQLLEMANALPPQERTGSGASPRRRMGASDPDFEKRMRIRRKMGELIQEEKPAMLIDPSFAGDGGTLFVQSASVEPGIFGRSFKRPWNKETPATIPQLVMAIEHYNRLARMIRQGVTPTMAVELKATFHDDDPMGYNTVAEIPGTDKADEVVMLGGHLDSWHSATGATDNAAGCAVMMEAARIIKTLDLKPRRTIRVALWSGEEQGLFGSEAYVQQHFGSIETDPLSAAVVSFVGGAPKRSLVKKPDYDKFAVYFNVDNGTGKLRGIHMEGNEAARPYFRRWFAPFHDLGAATLTPSRTGGTDHMSFDAIGLPGFQFIQDEIEYDARTHHSNMDVYDRLQADDLKQSSAIAAALVYQAATMDELFPRKPEPKP